MMTNLERCVRKFVHTWQSWYFGTILGFRRFTDVAKFNANNFFPSCPLPLVFKNHWPV